MPDIDEILAYIEQNAGADGHRMIVAIAGPPGSGKSTLAETLVERLGPRAALFPMDGFHLGNDELTERKLLTRKGAQATFDVAGYRHRLLQIRDDGDPVAIPVFNRAIDAVIEDATIIAPAHRVVITEGNYLLLNQYPWWDLCNSFDLTVLLREELSVLEERLIRRWTNYGLDPKSARDRTAENDIQNAQLVLENSVRADLIYG